MLCLSAAYSWIAYSAQRQSLLTVLSRCGRLWDEPLGPLHLWRWPSDPWRWLVSQRPWLYRRWHLRTFKSETWLYRPVLGRRWLLVMVSHVSWVPRAAWANVSWATRANVSKSGQTSITRMCRCVDVSSTTEWGRCDIGRRWLKQQSWATRGGS